MSLCGIGTDNIAAAQILGRLLADEGFRIGFLKTPQKVARSVGVELSEEHCKKVTQLIEAICEKGNGALSIGEIMRFSRSRVQA
jgi:hypothetical protein